ncbi:RNA polymerase sigma-70 factor [Echinicola jeungdonensis]|uniref:RNA polymerase sigma-70 factor n=1 Tax=Echinicola jeungdonensis TaxID=709343 RepID=A0ABV5JAW7_9BACT|nr:RNA polymerase sigma-70 factor [Echinicola jeungdonensis]MDN3669492.1 RNA polymerase sigma-70 factor [Echinicola jeungdonensis]
MRIEDKLLIKEIQKRNREVFKALFHDYYPGLLKFAEGFVFDKEVCEDIVQNIFVYIWEQAEYLNITTSFKSYLYKAVKNRCLNYLRSLKIEDKHNLLYLEASLNESPVDWEDSEIPQKIEMAIEGLPPKMAEIFRLKYMEEKSLREIATQLDVSENTIKTQLLRAKDKLRGILRESLDLNFFL